MNNKIKALLQMFGETISSYAKFTGRTQSNVSNKISRGSWNVEDFILLAKLTNTKLAFVDENNNPIITFDENDLNKK